MTIFLCLLGIAWTGGLSWLLVPALQYQLRHGNTAGALLSGLLLALLAGYLAVFVRRLVLFLRSPHQSALRAVWGDARSKMLHRARYVVWLDRRSRGRL